MKYKYPEFPIFLSIVAIILSISIFLMSSGRGKAPLVFMSDFSLKDAAVSTMHGVAYDVDSDIAIFDLTHEIPMYNVWEGAYRLYQTASYWPEGTVFVSVVDPGVGTERESIVAKTKTGHYFVNPNNGLLTLIEESLGIEEVRIIDEATNRRKDSTKSYTFHGRDVYAYTGARLASRKISFKEVGGALDLKKLVRIKYQKASFANGMLRGNIPILDVNYGNIWTNIPKTVFDEMKVQAGDTLNVKIYENNKLVYDGNMTYQNTFGDVRIGEPLVYINSLLNVAVALNMDDFAAKHNISAGERWSVQITKP